MFGSVSSGTLVFMGYEAHGQCASGKIPEAIVLAKIPEAIVLAKIPEEIVLATISEAIIWLAIPAKQPHKSQNYFRYF